MPTAKDTVRLRAAEAVVQKKAYAKAEKIAEAVYETHVKAGLEYGIGEDAFQRLSDDAGSKIIDFEMLKLPIVLSWEFGFDSSAKTFKGDLTAGTIAFNNAGAYRAKLNEQVKAAFQDPKIHSLLATKVLDKQSATQMLEKAMSSEPFAYVTFGRVSLLQSCSACNATGQVACSACSGTGRRGCNTCHASGAVTCSGCGGSGSKKERVSAGGGKYQERDVRCSRCNGQGKEVCPSCHGEKTRQCDTCQGNRTQVCDTCSGAKSLTEITMVHATAKPSITYAVGEIQSEMYGDKFRAWFSNVSKEMNLLAQFYPLRLDESRQETAGKVSIDYLAFPAAFKIRFKLNTSEAKYAVEYTDHLLASGHSMDPPRFLGQILYAAARYLDNLQARESLSIKEAVDAYRHIGKYAALDGVMRSLAHNPKSSVAELIDSGFGPKRKRSVDDSTAERMVLGARKVLLTLTRTIGPQAWVAVALLFGAYAFVLESGTAARAPHALTQFQDYVVFFVLAIPFLLLGYIGSRVLVWLRQRHLAKVHRFRGRERLAAPAALALAGVIAAAGAFPALGTAVHSIGLFAQAQTYVARGADAIYSQVPHLALKTMRIR